MALTLGLDSSTQSISGIIIDTDAGHILHEVSINFGESLPQYNAPSGYQTNEQGEFFADPKMWLDGLDLLLETLKDQGAPLDQIISIAGTAQQHATVYLNGDFEASLSKLVSSQPLSEQLQPTFSRANCPIWMDNTTGEQCDQLTEAAGRDYLIQHTGSIATARFSGPQIKKFAQQQPEAYAQTKHIHMCSSFMASVLAGKSISLDLTDASGMNLLDLTTLDWNGKLIEATAENLSEKLPPLAKSTTSLATISSYFSEKYGFSPDTQIIAWTGDNPASLVGMGASSPGRMVLSLGTSFTCFTAMDQPHTDPNGYGHVFCNPASDYMSLTCFQNGALTCEHLRSMFDLTWDQFNQYVSAAPSTERSITNPFLKDEITPPSQANSELHDKASLKPEQIREVLEGVFLNIRKHTEWINMSGDTIFVTGGASESTGICQMIANVFNKNVQRLQHSGSASLGAAMLASHAVDAADLSTLEQAFCSPDDVKYTPDADAVAVYSQL